MKRPIARTLCAASVAQCGVRSAAAFGAGDSHAHVHAFLSQPSLLRDSASILLSQTAATNPAQQAISTVLDPARHAAAGVFDGYMSALGSHPLPTKMLTGATLATAGDAIAQGRENDDYNAARGASFAAFDATYRASQHYLFPVIVELCRGQYLLGAMAALGAAGMADAPSLAAMECSLASQLIIVPFMYYPVFFTFTGAMQGLNFDEGLERAKENFVPLMKKNLLFWIPVQYVQFCYVPTDLQIPFLSCAGLAWTFLLSVLAGSARGYAGGDDSDLVVEMDGDRDVPLEGSFPNAIALADLDSRSPSGSERNGAREVVMK